MLISGTAGRDIYDQPKADFSGNADGYGMNWQRNAACPAVTYTAFMRMEQA